MNASDLCFPAYDAAAQHAQIRWMLFEHHGVHDVLPTLHADTLRIRHRGHAEPARWAETLTAAGFPAPFVRAAPTAPIAQPAIAETAD